MNYITVCTAARLLHPHNRFLWLTRAGAVYSHGRWWFIRAHSVSSLCGDESDRYEEGREWEKGRQTPIAWGDEEIKFHLTLKNLLYKTNYFSKESFHRCMAVGPACRNMITLPALGCLCSLCGALRWAPRMIYSSLSLPAAHTAYLQI